MAWWDALIVSCIYVFPLLMCYRVDSEETSSQGTMGKKLSGLQAYHFIQFVLYLGPLSHNCWFDKIHYFPWNKNYFQYCKIDVLLDFLSEHWAWTQCPRHTNKKDCNYLTIWHQLRQRSKFYFNLNYIIVLLQFSLWSWGGTSWFFLSLCHSRNYSKHSFLASFLMNVYLIKDRKSIFFMFKSYENLV